MLPPARGAARPAPRQSAVNHLQQLLIFQDLVHLAHPRLPQRLRLPREEDLSQIALAIAPLNHVASCLEFLLCARAPTAGATVRDSRRPGHLLFPGTPAKLAARRAPVPHTDPAHTVRGFSPRSGR